MGFNGNIIIILRYFKILTGKNFQTVCKTKTHKTGIFPHVVLKNFREMNLM